MIDPGRHMFTFNLSQSPVLALENNILWQFENLSPYAAQKFKAQVTQGLLSGEILLDVTAACPATPRVETNGELPPVVHLQVAYLELLWAFIYGWMVVYEEGVQKPQIEGHPPPEDGEAVELIARADKLLLWAQSLSAGYTLWPAHLPSPRSYATDREQYYGEKANLVFQKATAYVLSHERAHAVQGHLEFVRKSGTSRSLQLDLEKEADLAAFDDLISPGLDDNEKSSEAWAVLSVMLSSFYVCREPRDALISKSHPALHHRLAYVVRSLAFQDERYKYYFPFLCRLVLQVIFPEPLRLTKRFEYAQDAFDNALDVLDELVPI